MPKQFTIPANECSGIARAFDNVKASQDNLARWTPLEVLQARNETAVAQFNMLIERMGRIYGFDPSVEGGDNWQTLADGSILVTLKDVPEVKQEPLVKAPEAPVIRQAPEMAWYDTNGGTLPPQPTRAEAMPHDVAPVRAIDAMMDQMERDASGPRPPAWDCDKAKVTSADYCRKELLNDLDETLAAAKG